MMIDARRSTLLRISAGLFAGMIAAPACAPDPADGGFEVRDSAGIAILSSHRAAWTVGAPGAWSVDSIPLLQIGAVDGDSSLQFHGVTGATRLSDGRIVVAEASTSRVRYFSPDGRFLHAVGRRGRGPGEFQFLRQLRQVGGDSLLAWDHAQNRVTILDPQGGIAGSVRLEGTGYDPLGLIFRLSDGRLIAGGSWSTAQLAEDVAPGLYRPGTAIFRFAPDGRLQDTVTVIAGADMASVDVEGRRVVGLPHFARQPATAVVRDEVYAATGDSLEIRVHRPSGELLRIIRGPQLDLAYSPADLRAQRDAQVAAAGGDRTRFDPLFAAMPLPPQRPAHARMFVDPAGSVWLEPFAGFVDVDRPWTVFGPDGRLLGAVEMPPSLHVLEIGDDHVLGIWRDELDVEYLRLHALDRGTP